MYENGDFIKARIKRGLRKMMWIFLWSTGLFALVKLCVGLVLGKELYLLSLHDLANWLFFNVNPFGGHLWYISAYFYVLLLAYIINKHRLWKEAFYLVPLLLVVDLAFGKYSLLLWGEEFPYYWLRNFLFVGFPYYALGAWIKATDIRVKCEYVLTGGVIFSLTSFIEYGILSYLCKNPVRDHYLSTTGLSLCLFLLFVTIKQSKPNLLSSIGEKDSLYIYIFHPLFIYYFFPVLNQILPHPLLLVYNYSAPLQVLALTLLLICSLRKMRILS